MDHELTNFINGRLPLRIDLLDYNDPVYVLVGDDWSLSVACPWRLVRDDQVVTSIDDPDAERHLNECVGRSINAVAVVRGRGGESQPVLALDDGSRLEVLPDTGLDPWVMRMSGQSFVGHLN
jgi:hypothetical protein